MADEDLASLIDQAAAERRAAPPEAAVATLHLTLARAGATPVALPVANVVELIAVQECVVAPLPHLPAPFAGLVRRRGRLLPVADLSLRLDGSPASMGTTGRLVVCRHGNGDFGLLVDEVTAVTTVPERSRRDLASSAWTADDEFVAAIIVVQGHEHLLLDLDRLWHALHAAVPRRKGAQCIA